MTITAGSSATGEAEQKLETRRIGEDCLTLILSGRWCLDQALPSHEVVERELAGGVRCLAFDATGLGAWDSGLLTFLAGVIKACTRFSVDVDQDGLPEGIRHLLAMAFAVPEQKVAGRGGENGNLFVRVGRLPRILSAARRRCCASLARSPCPSCASPPAVPVSA